MRKMLVAFCATASLLMAACTTTGAGGDTTAVAPAEPFRSGFLPDYSKLRPVEGKVGVQRYVDRSVDLRPFTKLYIDPVKFIAGPADAGAQDVPPDAVRRITDSFYKAFVDTVTPAYQVVGAPGPDVLRVRMAITGAQAVATPLGVTDFIPVKAVFNAGRALAGDAPRLAELSAELEVLDGQNRQVAAAVVTRRTEATLPQGERITWSELSPIGFAWARQFRQGLDELRGVGTR